MLHAFAILAMVLQSPSPDARQVVYDALRANDIALASRTAAAHALARRDSFLVREVARFAARSPAERAAWQWSDSLRRAGIVAMGRDGAAVALSIWRRALRRTRAIDDSAQAAALNGNIGAAFLRLGQLDSAAPRLTRAAAQARAVGDRRVEANALTASGALEEQRGNLDGARAFYGQSLALHEQLEDARGLAADRNNLGLLAWEGGDPTEARRQFEAALELNRREGREDVAATNMVNLAGIASLEGRFTTGQRLYADALSAWKAAEAWADAADALAGLGELELRRGDYPASRRALEEALAIYVRTGPQSSELRMRTTLAGVLAAEGGMQAARDALRVAEERARDASPEMQVRVLLSRADLEVQLNALGDAERLYQRAAQLARQSGDAVAEAAAQHGQGLLLLERDDLAGAERLLQSARRGQQSRGDRRATGLTSIALGGVARARGDTALARRRLEQATAELAQAGDPVGEAAALGALGDLAAERGQPAAAEAFFRQALARLRNRPAPGVAWRLHAGLGHARQARAATADAVAALRSAVAEVEHAGRSLRLPERRAGFWEDKWDVYSQLALLEQASGDAAAAFETSERLRAREMVELLGRGRIVPPLDARPEGAAEREQDLRHLIARLTTELEADPAGPLRGPASRNESGAVREALLAAQAAYAELMLDLRERSPRHAELVAPRPASWRDVSARLRRDEAFVEYLVGDSGAVAFLVTRDTMAVVDLAIGRHALRRLVEFARGTVETAQAASDSLWHGPFRRLHGHLIAPLEETGLLARVTKLVVAPHAELHYLPLAALLGESGPLVGRYELSTTASATAWLALGDRSQARHASGILAMTPHPSQLPGSVAEAEAIRRFAQDEVLALGGDSATEGAFRAVAERKRVLHLATYGVLNKQNPLFSFIDFAPGNGEDGRLEVHEVLGLSLAADLVVLSACETGLGSGRLADVPPGDDWVGLTRAFLHAGARAVVATLWAVDDRATASLMGEFYRWHGAGRPPAEALARAQRTLLATRATAHPFHWAGVMVAEGQAP